MAAYDKDYNSVPQIGFTQAQMDLIAAKEASDRTAKNTAYTTLAGEASTGFPYTFNRTLPDYVAP
jgi:hypothetical protein